MAKTITEVLVTNTFQNWLDKTNELVDLVNNDIMTASPAGDITVGNATLQGNFTATNLTANTRIRSDLISPRTGTSVGFDSPFTATNNATTILGTLAGALGPRLSFTDNAAIWQVGFEDNTTKNFVISSGSSAVARITSAGDFEVTGSITSPVFSGNLTGNVNGNVSGTVSTLSNHTTDVLSEGSSNLYFTTARARSSISASGALSYNSSTGVMSITDSSIRGLLSGGTGVSYNSTTGVIAIGQAVGVTDNVSFASSTLSGALNIRPLGNAAIEHGRIDGTTSTPFIDFHSSGNNIDYDSRISANGGTSTVGAGSLLYIANGGHTFTGAISSNGDITAFSSSSDIRKKENIIKIDKALEKVSQIGGYTYNFKGDNRKLTGVIAQEIEQVLPEVIYEIDDEEYGKSKAVRYGNIVGLLIEAIKELKEKVDRLENGN